MASGGAAWSPCRQYRYTLWRRWPGLLRSAGVVAFIGLNPSTADETTDDPTVRRCVGFAKRWGYAGMWMLNIFAYRATDPEAMKAVADPVGPRNDAAILTTAGRVCQVVACWGGHGAYHDRGLAVRALLQKSGTLLYHLGLTKYGHPRHPLYLSAMTERHIWNWPE